MTDDRERSRSIEPEELPPLTVETKELFAKFRAVDPPPAIVEDAFARIRAVDPAARDRRRPTEILERARRHARSQRLAPWLALAPAIGIAGVVLALLARGDAERAESAAIERTEELLLDLPPGDEHGTVHLDLATHHHDESAARVEVHAHESLGIGVPGRATHHVERECSADMCRHVYEHSNENPDHRRTLRVTIGEPGRYEIRVEHDSSRARVRERFIVHAREPSPS